MPSRVSLCRKCSDTILFYWESHVKIQVLYQMWIASDYFGSTWECHVSHFAFYMGTSWTLVLPPASPAMALYDRKKSEISHHLQCGMGGFFLLFFLLPCQAKVATQFSFILESKFKCLPSGSCFILSLYFLCVCFLLLFLITLTYRSRQCSAVWMQTPEVERALCHTGTRGKLFLPLTASRGGLKYVVARRIPEGSLMLRRQSGDQVIRFRRLSRTPSFQCF